MLVLSRRIGEKIVIGDGIVVTVVEVHRDSVRLGVDAPRSVPVNRAELVKAVSEENVAALNIDAAALTSLKGIKPLSTTPLDLRKLMRRSALTSASNPVSPESPTPAAGASGSAAPVQSAAASPAKQPPTSESSAKPTPFAGNSAVPAVVSSPSAPAASPGVPAPANPEPGQDAASDPAAKGMAPHEPPVTRPIPKPGSNLFPKRDPRG